MKIKVSAPGKLMLLGEHAVVYGYPCIVTAVDKRLYVEAEKYRKEEDKIITPQVKECRFVLESIAQFKEKFGIAEAVKITTQGDFSHNVGLGSSSAVTAATFKALAVLFNKPLTLKEIFNLSYKVNLKIQGVGSGFDLAAAVFGNTLYFITGGKIIEPLAIKQLPLIVGYSGTKADTPFYVRTVAEKFKSEQKELKKIFIAIADLVEKAKADLLSGNFSSAGRLMTKNHGLLRKLGVSTGKLDGMVNAAVDAGAYGAKLSGAGGGDCMIALIPEKNRDSVTEAIERSGGEVIKVVNNAAGVRLEK